MAVDFDEISPRLVVRFATVYQSFWFVPTVMTAIAIALAFLMIELDRGIGDDPMPVLFTGGPDGARSLLGSITTSMITVASLVFSVTMVVLSLTSQQYGPRVLRNFMSDLGNQVVLGTFIATFVYSILVLRTVRGGDGAQFVPNLAVTVAVVLSLLSLAVLVYFIHHISSSIQVSNLVATIGRDLDRAIDRLFPVTMGAGHAEGPPEADIEDALASFEAGEARPLLARGSGYLQVIEGRHLLDAATERDLVVLLTCRPGQHVTEGSVVAEAYARAGELADAAAEEAGKAVNQSLVLGRQRTPGQDVEFAVDQIVQIALRALSPALNDPLTALQCVDRLGVSLLRLAGREQPSPYRYDGSGVLRIIAYPLGFAGVLDDAFDEIRQSAASHVSVMMRLFETITLLGPRVTGEDNRAALLRQAEMLRRGFQRDIPEPVDRHALEERYQRAIRAVSLQQPQVDRGKREARHEDDGRTEPAERVPQP